MDLQLEYESWQIILLSVSLIFLGAVITWIKKVDKKNKKHSQSSLPELDFYNRLSPREKEVLQKIHEGKSNKQIAEELFIDLTTVKTHINNAYKTILVKDRAEAKKFANRIFNRME